ncbi:hypothetical protein GQ600_17405 [Phytophthora cactorum]|nr:hypothetical protein GQ600_17405 [Phytophthora cactorum]
MTTTVAQEPTRPPTSSPRRLATAEERQRVLTAYERGDDWLTVARCNNNVEGSCLPAVQDWRSKPACSWRRTCKRRQEHIRMVTSCGGCTEDGGHAVWDIG